MVAAYLAGWYGQGRPTAGVLSNLAPFALFFGGLAQFLAGMWCYRARDGLGTAMHGMWGAFWMGFGVFFILAGAGVLDLVTTAGGFVVALFKNASLATVLFTLATGTACVAIGFSTGVITWTRVGGYALVASAALAVYTALAMMFEEAVGRVILPVGKYPYSRKEH